MPLCRRLNESLDGRFQNHPQMRVALPFQGQFRNLGVVIDHQGAVFFDQFLQCPGQFRLVLAAGGGNGQGKDRGKGAGLGRLAHTLDLLHWRQEATREIKWVFLL